MKFRLNGYPNDAQSKAKVSIGFICFCAVLLQRFLFMHFIASDEPTKYFTQISWLDITYVPMFLNLLIFYMKRYTKHQTYSEQSGRNLKATLSNSSWLDVTQ